MLNRVRRSFLAFECNAAHVAQLRQEIDDGRVGRKVNVKDKAILRAENFCYSRRLALTVKAYDIGKQHQRVIPIGDKDHPARRIAQQGYRVVYACANIFWFNRCFWLPVHIGVFGRAVEGSEPAGKAGGVRQRLEHHLLQPHKRVG